MAIDATGRLKRWWASNTQDTTAIATLTFFHSFMTEPFTICDYGKDIVVVFEDAEVADAFNIPFKFILPSIRKNTFQKLSVQIDGMSDQIYDLVQTLPREERFEQIQLFLRIYLDDDLNNPQTNSPLKMVSQNVSFSSESVRFDCIAPTNARNYKSGLRYDPTIWLGLL